MENPKRRKNTGGGAPVNTHTQPTALLGNLEEAIYTGGYTG
jgi:hypothetical protein